MNNEENKPPGFAAMLLRILTGNAEEFDIFNTIKDLYCQKYKKQGKYKANFWFRKQVLFSILKFYYTKIIFSFSLINNYIKITLRNIKKRKIFSAINIFGFAIGLACCMILILLIMDDLSYDKFHKNRDNIFRVYSKSTIKDNTISFGSVPAPLGPTLKEDFPEVQESVRLISAGKLILRNDNITGIEKDVYFADSQIFEVFTFPFVFGEVASSLKDPLSIVIDQKTAAKYFQDNDPLGKIITIDNQIDVTVTGVIKNLPKNSTLQFNILLPINSVLNTADINWNSTSCENFLLLQYKNSAENISKNLPNWIEQKTDNNFLSFHLQPFKDIHLYGLEGSGAMNSIIEYFSLAFFAVIIGCFNFINLSTAMSGRRALEIGIRKVIGANKKDIVRQYLGESIILCFISAIFALFLVYIILPYVNLFLSKSLVFYFKDSFSILIWFLLIIVLTGLLSGCYPAFFLSSLEPINSIGTFKSGKNKRSFRKHLLIIQFTLAIIFIIITIANEKQMNFLTKMDLGFDKKNIITFPMKTVKDKYELLREELIKYNNIQNITAASTLPYGGCTTTTVRKNKRNGDITELKMQLIATDRNFFDVFNIDILHGRNFSFESNSDLKNYIINETAVKALELENPIGKPFIYGNKSGMIIGVVKDFNYQGTSIKIKPMFLKISPPINLQHIFVKLNSNSAETIAYLKSKFKEYFPYTPLEYEFIDSQRGPNIRKANIMLLKYISSFIIFIACIGLFAMTLFLTMQKTKEIAVRKVFGAQSQALVLYLLKEYLTPVFIAVCIAIPTSWFLIKDMQADVPYHVNIGWSIYVLAIIFVLIISLFTVIFHILKSAVANPVDSLRYE